ncbi:hypothetical protein B834_2392 [Enterococcus mundtii 1A]|nr:hypothetical protein [Enterococcus mundtii 1A]
MVIFLNFPIPIYIPPIIYIFFLFDFLHGERIISFPHFCQNKKQLEGNFPSNCLNNLLILIIKSLLSNSKFHH